MTIELIDEPERLAELADSWEDLVAGTASAEVFALPAWVLAWFAQIGTRDDRRLAAVAVWDDAALVGLMPLQSSVRFGVRMIEFTGFPRHADRMALVLDERRQDEILLAFATWLAARRDWDVLSLRSFGGADDQPEALAGALRNAGLRHLIRPGAATYHVDLTPYADVDAYLAEVRSGRTRKALRRHARRLGEEHGWRWHVYRELDDVLLDELVDLDARRSVRGAEERAFLGEAANVAFLRDLARRLAGRDFWRITALRPGERVLAYDISFQLDGRRLSYQTAFDRSLVAYGTGTLALIEALRGAIEEGCREFDFLAGDEGYKENWCREARRCRWVLAFRGGPRSRIAYGYHRWLKPLRTRLAQGRLGALVPRRLRDRFDI